MQRASIQTSQNPFPVLAQHVFYNDAQIIAGLSRYPTTRGHSLVSLKQTTVGLFSLDRGDFVKVMTSIKGLTETLEVCYNVGRCARVTEGDSFLSMIPLHDFTKEWKPILADSKEFNETYPGYINSKDGPQMDSERLSQIASSIKAETGISEPFNYRFQGDKNDNNLFARLVRGELPQSRIWETDDHVAFLTPFANTPSFAVFVPCAHLSSDIFRLEDDTYSKLMGAAHTVTGHLMKTFLASRCGMIFEGFEIDYAHVKLIPTHESDALSGTQKATPPVQTTTFEETYNGYVTSLNGPLCSDQGSLGTDASSLR
ncbi:uncharacterized protein BDZ99DRAFT_466380 [Mytilinidion resinicola]|uniref:HIT domain-containing protein n=1 Tax=Mytilinidion resinicola TaxID=574789 RepID=A0A6A6YDN2_9PEZI|nr:uncharacterized protein BDZ99DRAFT_466380 [Mytilinidion resinicola]KAF2806104.1 hypothetical protein BDZ99DRAFT_466380 [Mytilinidion resinicola]